MFELEHLSYILAVCDDNLKEIYDKIVF
jgi:hypothetical protein